jgi:tetratricopeptide (TPR) repeat protein
MYLAPALVFFALRLCLDASPKVFCGIQDESRVHVFSCVFVNLYVNHLFAARPVFHLAKTPILILGVACRKYSVDIDWLAKRVAKKCITKDMIERVAATLPQDGTKISREAQEQSHQLVAQAIRFLSSEEDVALRGFKLALQRNPLLISALSRIGKMKMRSGDLQSSRLYMERAFVLHPGNPECVLGYADALLALGDSYGALRVYEAIVSDFSKSEAVSDQLKDAKEVDAGFNVYLDSLASCGLLYYQV